MCYYFFIRSTMHLSHDKQLLHNSYARRQQLAIQCPILNYCLLTQIRELVPIYHVNLGWAHPQYIFKAQVDFGSSYVKQMKYNIQN